MKTYYLRISTLTVGIIICCVGLTLLTWLTFINFTVALTGIALFLAISGTALIAFQINTVRREEAIRRETGEIKRVFFENSPLGLVSVSTDASAHDYSELIISPRRLVIVLNDGRTWLSIHKERLRKRFSDPTKTTTIFLLHPRSEFLSTLAKKESTDVRNLQTKIYESLEIIASVRQSNQRLEVLGHHLYNTQSVVVGDAEAAVTPYFLSRGGRTVPVYTFIDMGGPCYFRDIADDVDQLRLDSEAFDNFSIATPDVNSKPSEQNVIPL